MPLTKTSFVGQQSHDPACFGCCAAMAAGVSLDEFKEIVGRDSLSDGGGYSLQEIVTFLLSQGMMFTPGGYLYNVTVKEEVPGVTLNVTIDADTLAVLEGYAEQINMDVSGAVNGILTRALTQYGARSREGYRYVAHAGYSGKEISERVKGYLKYVVPTINEPAFVIVKSDYEHDHCLYWDGGLLWNPAEPEENNPVPLEDYTVVAWHQVGKFEDKNISSTRINFLSEEP